MYFKTLSGAIKPTRNMLADDQFAANKMPLKYDSVILHGGRIREAPGRDIAHWVRHIFSGPLSLISHGARDPLPVSGRATLMTGSAAIDRVSMGADNVPRRPGHRRILAESPG